MKTGNQKNEILIIALIFIISIIFAIAIGIKRHGDDPSYYSMVESLVKDGDFILGSKDLSRWGHNELQISPSAAYVIIDKKGVMKYAKPILYPLIAAPFFFLGIKGLALLNGLFLGGSIALSYLYLKRYFNRNNSLFIAGSFFLCSFMPAYVSWIHPEMMLYFACVLSMWLWLYKEKPALAALVMGIVSSLRVEFFLLFILLIVVVTFWKKFKELPKLIMMYLLGYGFMLFITFLVFGQFSAYSGERYFIPGKIGQPYLSLQEIKSFLISTHSMFEGSEFNSLGLFFRNIANFFIGRFTGVIWYAFPAVICVIIYLFYRHKCKREEKILGDGILAIMLVLAVILIIARPLNYFGGKDFICNRYLSILPSLLFLPGIKVIRKPAKVILLFLLGLTISSQIIINEMFIKNSNKRYFAHTTTFPLKYAPLGLIYVESFMIYNTRIKISEDLFLYTPLGVKMRDGKKILLSKNQEAVFIRSDSAEDIILTTDFGRVFLKSKIVLKNKINKESKSFYYFKPHRSIWISDIQS